MAGKKQTDTAKSTVAKKSVPKTTVAQRKPKQKNVPENHTNQFWSVILFALGVLVLMLVFIPGNSGWYRIHNFIRGMFGFSVIFVPVILVYSAILIARERSQETIAGRAVWGVCLMFLTSSVIQIFMVGSIPGSDFGLKMQNLYKLGKDLEGGGLISAIIAWPLIKLFGGLGSKLIVIILLFISIMLLTNLGLLDFLGLFYKPFCSMGRSLKMIHEENVFLNRYDKENPSDIDEDEDEDEVKPTKSEKVKKKSEPEFVDIPIFESDINIKDTDEYKNEEALSLVSPKPIENIPKTVDGFDMDIPVSNLETTKKVSTDTSFDVPITDNTVVKDDSGIIEESQPPASIIMDAGKDKEENTSELDSIIMRAVENKEKPKAEVVDEEFDIQDEVNQNKKETVHQQYQFPPIDFLKHGINKAHDVSSTIELKQKADTLVETLKSFGVQTRIVDINRGPSVTRYELQPAAGVKISRITGLSDDIALNLAAAGVRIEAPIPGKAAVGIEIPNTNKDLVTLREILESTEFKNAKSKLAFAVGKDIAGNVILGDVAKMPHVIIAGATGSGKSVCTNSIIMSILYHSTPDEVRLVLIDPKIVEFKVYDGIPHLLIPVVTDPKKAAGALNWAVQEMLRRYKMFADNNVRDLTSYNELAAEREDINSIPQIVIAIDELADLMMAASKEVEDAICRLAQMARAAGMHLIIATQRPTVNVITGLIKANIPSRIALSVMSQTDSRTILDIGGAEKLLGYGDMLYFPNGIPKPIRVQGCFCSTKEIESVVGFIKNQSHAEYSDEILEEIEKNIPVSKDERDNMPDESVPEGDEAIIEKSIDLIVEMGQASTSFLQRKLKLGYARAARVVDELENMGVVGPSEGAKPRKVLMSKQQWAERKMNKRCM